MTQVTEPSSAVPVSPPSTRGPTGPRNGPMIRTFNRTFDWNDRGWRNAAACRDSDPALFFPVGSTGAAIEEITAAKSVCQGCPVAEQCLMFALKTNQESGIWGGTSEDERRRLRKRWLARRRQGLTLT